MLLPLSPRVLTFIATCSYLYRHVLLPLLPRALTFIATCSYLYRHVLLPLSPRTSWVVKHNPSHPSHPKHYKYYKHYKHYKHSHSRPPHPTCPIRATPTCPIRVPSQYKYYISSITVYDVPSHTCVVTSWVTPLRVWYK